MKLELNKNRVDLYIIFSKINLFLEKLVISQRKAIGHARLHEVIRTRLFDKMRQYCGLSYLCLKIFVLLLLLRITERFQRKLPAYWLLFCYFSEEEKCLFHKFIKFSTYFLLFQ